MMRVSGKETTPFLFVLARHTSSSSNSDHAWQAFGIVAVVFVLGAIADRRRSRRNKQRIGEYFAARGSEALLYYNERLGGRRSGYRSHYDIRHLGVDVRFNPSLKAHPALLVNNLPALITWLEMHGVNPVQDEPLPGYRRVYVSDPFQNRIELLELLTVETG